MRRGNASILLADCLLLKIFLRTENHPKPSYSIAPGNVIFKKKKKKERKRKRKKSMLVTVV